MYVPSPSGMTARRMTHSFDRAIAALLAASQQSFSP